MKLIRFRKNIYRTLHKIITKICDFLIKKETEVYVKYMMLADKYEELLDKESE